MQKGLQEMFEIFNAAWIQRFDELQQAVYLQQTPLADNDDTHNAANLAADSIMSKTELHSIRDRVFPELFRHVQREKQLRVRSSHLTNHDYQQSVGLLKHDEMKIWFATDRSKILGVKYV